MKSRYNSAEILKDLNRKIVLLGGPRQSGKTTLAKSLMSEYDYLNFDNSQHRLLILKQSWDRSKPLIIFDELHKMKNWKRWLKGIYDVEARPPAILVTGSARLELLRNVGDSLAGRFFQHRLYPFDLKELQAANPEEALEVISNFSGFPEPFFEGRAEFYGKWRVSYIDSIIRQDLIDLENVRDISSLFTLIELIKERVGTAVNFSTFAQILERDAKTIKNWIDILERMYVIFRVKPFHKSKQRLIKKEQKLYFFDVAQLKDNRAAQIENIVALSLLKELHRLEDLEGRRCELYYIRTSTGQEIDCVIEIDGKVTHLIEVKTSDHDPHPAFKLIAPNFKGVKAIQVVRNLEREFTFPSGLQIRRAAPWLASLNLTDAPVGT